MSTLAALKTEVLDWLDLDPESSNYDAAILRSANNVTAAINRNRKLPLALKTVTLVTASTADIDPRQVSVNPTLSYSTDTPPWDPTAIPDWTPYPEYNSGDYEFGFPEPVTEDVVDGMNYVYSGWNSELSFNPGEVGGNYLYQSVTVDAGKVYQLTADMDAANGTDELDITLPPHFLGVVATDGKTLTILSRNQDCYVDVTDEAIPSLLQTKAAEIIFFVDGASGETAEIDIRAGWNVLEYAYANVTLEVSKFTLRNVTLRLGSAPAESSSLHYTLSLPADCARIETIRIGGFSNPPLEQIDPGQGVYGAGRQGFWLEGKTVRLLQGYDPLDPPDILLTYYQAYPAFSDFTGTHDALVEYSRLYLWGVLSDLSAYLQDDEGRARYMSDYSAAFDEIVRDAEDQEYQNGYPMAVEHV